MLSLTTSRQWRDYFRANAANQLSIPWDAGADLTPEEAGAYHPLAAGLAIGRNVGRRISWPRQGVTPRKSAIPISSTPSRCSSPRSSDMEKRSADSWTSMARCVFNAIGAIRCSA